MYLGRRTKLVTGAVAAIAVAASSTAWMLSDRRADDPAGYGPPPQGDVQLISGSLAESYYTLAEVAAAADAVVIGTVEGIAHVESRDPSDRQNPGTPSTDFTFTVEEVVRGEAGESIVIHQLGGVVEDTTWEFTSDPLFVPGERHLLFLKRSPETGLYFAAGPPGRYFIVDDRIYSVSAAYPDRNITDLGFDGRGLSAGLEEIEAMGE